MRRYFLSALATLLLPVCTWPQTTGLPPFGSLDRIGSETRNNQDLNVLLAIPIMSSPGRGMNLDFGVVYNSSIWSNSGNAWAPSPSNPNWGWITSYSTGQVTYKYSTRQIICNHVGDPLYIYTTTYNTYKYVDPAATSHSFSVSWQEVVNQCNSTDIVSGTFTGYATDGSGYFINLSSVDGSLTSLLSKGGFNFPSTGLMIDTNGNYISGGPNWTDSAGRVALKTVTGSSSIQYEFLDPTGAYQTTTLNLENLSVKTNFGCSNVSEYTGTASVPQSIVLPNNQTYTFTYESYVSGGNTYYTGRLKRVALPTGGYYEYDYTGSNDGINCTDGTTLSMNRVVSDGTNTATWNYVRNTSNLTTTITTPVLADTPNANDMVVTFNSSGEETSRKIYANSPGTGTPLRTINTTWASDGTPATQVTILDDGSTQSEVDTTYDSNGLLDSAVEYGFGSGTRGALIRTTNFTYNTSTNYTNLNIIDLVTSKQIKDATGTVVYRQDTAYDATIGDNQNCPTGVAQHLDGTYGCSFYYRGNPTSVTTYLTPATQGGPVTKNFTYDFFGNLLTAQVNCCQNKTWTYSSTTKYSQPDSVQSGTSPGPTLTTSATYNAYTGQVATATDENNLVTNFNYDTLRRPTKVWQTIGSTNGASVSYSYDDVHFTATSTTTIDSTKSVQQITAVDTLGRPNLSTIEDVNNNLYSKVSAAYDLAGRAYQTSNPYKGSSGSYWTTTSFDVLGRPKSVTLPAPDSSVTSYSYTTNSATVTDPAGIKRESIADGAGRLSSIYEPDPTNGNTLTLQTSYTYNVLDELTQITQGLSQTRTYAYDALGRLNSATTPEAGTVCFGTYSGSTCQSNGYDSFDNLLYRTDARGVVTNYIYDSLNRLLGVTYPTVPSGVAAMPNVCETTGSSSNNANVCFTYGTSAASYNNGRVSVMNDGLGSESYTYNNLGQMTQLQKVISSTTYTTGYQYNVANELTQITYPSTRVVQQYVDPIGHVCAIATSTTSCTTFTGPFATGFGYSSANQVTGFEYGNSVYASFGFSSDRLQLNCLDYSTTNRSGTCTHDGTSKFSLTYSYGSAGSNNGQISSITDNMDSGRNITYTYDALYRMTNAATNGSTNYPAWGLKETYDRYGNRSAQSTSSGCTGITCPTNSVTVSATTNQITGSPYTYDASGDMTNDGVNTLTYDGEGRAVAASGSLGSGTYTVDGNGLRVKKAAGGTTTVYIFSGSKVIAEYQNGAAPSAPTTEYIYAGGALIAKINSSGTNYYHQDHLSNRYVTNSSGGKVAEMGHFPFGESWYNATSDKLLFTTYERDSESGNDYAMARYHVSRLGRLSSPDPLSGSTANPQSLNRYAYSINDPANLTDPSGAQTGCQTAQEHPTNEAQEGAGHGPSTDSDAEAQVQGRCSQSLLPGGSGISLDGADMTDMPTALLGTSDSTTVYLGAGAGGGWLVNPSGGYYNPSSDCYTDPNRNNSKMYCGGAAFDEAIGTSSASDGSEFGLTDPLDGDSGGSSGGGPGRGMDKAKLMLLKLDCSNFIANLVFATALPLESGSSGFEDAQTESANSAESMVQTLTETTYTTSATNPQVGNYTTIAFTNAGSRDVTLYAGYGQQSLTGQGQTLIHEAVHDAFGFSDQQLAQTLTGTIYPGTPLGIAQAGNVFNQALIAHCK